jgi:deoxyribose-phosphate aldolase
VRFQVPAQQSALFVIPTVDLYSDLDQVSAIASLIDQTLLKPEASEVAILALCSGARVHGFAAVCVNPYWVEVAFRELDGSLVKVCTVVGFPLGANEGAAKLYEADRALSHGALELDMVLNIGALRGGDSNSVLAEISQLARLAHGGDALLKVILETCLLNDEEKRRACRMAVEAGADFVKTSTGFSTGGATLEDIRLMRAEVGDRAGVKASGGIRTFSALREMVRAGATRIGTSSGVEIMCEWKTERDARRHEPDTRDQPEGY